MINVLLLLLTVAPYILTDRLPVAITPVGMADFHEGGSKDADGNELESAEEKFFFLVKEDYCKGHEEDKEWSVGEWRSDQGVDIRDDMNREWLRLVMRRKSFGHQATLSEQAKRMFFMASTDLSHFRRFIFESTFLETYELDAETIAKIKEDDVALMLFSFEYLASSLFGTQTLNIKEEKVKAKIKKMKEQQDDAVISAVKDYEDLKEHLDVKK